MLTKQLFRNTCIIAMLLSTVTCYAKHIDDITSLARLPYVNGSTEVTGSYELLSKTNYTNDMSSYVYDNYILKIENKDDPEKIIFKITRSNKLNEKHHLVDITQQTLPWWSKFVPVAIKKLDFSAVTGRDAAYKINNKYVLNRLSKQGRWGSVYALEELDDNRNIKKICAVKILFARDDRNKSEVAFELRHQQEINNIIKLANFDSDLATLPYGIIKNTDNTYMIFLEYGSNAEDFFNAQTKSKTIEQLYFLMKKINTMHAAGFTHGDLKVDNMVIINNKIKLCDWFSLNEFNTNSVEQYRTIGDTLPQEALRAFYYGENDALENSIREALPHTEYNFIHPIAADRYFFAASLLDILAPDLYNGFNDLRPQNVALQKDISLMFWQKHVDYVHYVQQELLKRAVRTKNSNESQLLIYTARCIDLDPLQRG